MPTFRAWRAALYWTLILALTSCASVGGGGSSSSDSKEVVARIEGRPITLGELDQFIRDELFAGETENSEAARLYAVRAKYLEQLVSDAVIEAEAERRGMTRDELIQQQVEALGPVTEAEAEKFYEENKARIRTPGSFEELQSQITTFLERERTERAIEELRESARVEILLQRPRFDVAAIGPSRGRADAPITIVEFSDFQCPFCQRALDPLNEVLARYPQRVRLVYRHLPLDIHPEAFQAATAAVCADEQGKFWAFHDLLFANQRTLKVSNLQTFAFKVGMDVKTFKACFESEEARARVQTDIDAARALRISGTPAFFVNGVYLSGAHPAADFEKIIDEELARLP